MMPENWKTYKLGEIAQLKTGKLNSNAAVISGKYPFFTCSPETLKIDNYAFDCEALLLAGNNANGIFSLKYYKGKFNAYQRTYIIEVKNEDFDIRFLYYSLGKELNSFQNLSQGSATKFLTVKILNEFELKIPSINEQRRIAAVLSALDEKIELNLEMNRTLEQIAQAIFKRWFVDFEFPGFNGEFVDGLPKGWRVDEFKKHLNVERGLSYKGEGLVKQGEGIPMHNLNSVYEGGGYKYEGIKFYNGVYREKHIAKPRDVIVANTEQGHKYLLIGYPAVIPHYFGDVTIFSHHIYRVRPNSESYLTPQFIYYLLLEQKIREEIIGCTNGTTVNMLKIDGLQMPEFVLPTQDLISEFSDLIENIWQRQENNFKENQTLTQLRDSLLPKLMSGKIRVAE